MLTPKSNRSLNRATLVLCYLADNIPFLSITSAMKLLYLIDETSTIETGSSVTGMTYRVWEQGPVPRKMHQELKAVQDKQPLRQMLKVHSESISGYNYIFLTKSGDCDLDIFSRYDLDLFDRIVKLHGSKTANQLVSEAHAPGTLWSLLVEKHKIDFNGSKTSSIKIDLESLLEKGSLKKIVGEVANDSIELSSTIGGHMAIS